LVVAFQNGSRQVVEAPWAVFAFVTLAFGLGFVLAALDGVVRSAMWAGHAARPTEFPYFLEARGIADQCLDINQGFHRLQPTPKHDLQAFSVTLCLALSSLFGLPASMTLEHILSDIF
jgi:hypothetical protein